MKHAALMAFAPLALSCGTGMLAGCMRERPAAIPASQYPADRAAAYRCRDKGLDHLIGRIANAATGMEALRLSGARVLRWAPPRAGITMDFRVDRLTIGYDDAMVIRSARCG